MMLSDALETTACSTLVAYCLSDSNIGYNNTFKKAFQNAVDIWNVDNTSFDEHAFVLFSVSDDDWFDKTIDGLKEWGIEFCPAVYNEKNETYCRLAILPVPVAVAKLKEK